MKKANSNKPSIFSLLQKIIMPIIIIVLMFAIVLCFFIAEKPSAGYCVIAMSLFATACAIVGIVFVLLTPVQDEEEKSP